METSGGTNKTLWTTAVLAGALLLTPASVRSAWRGEGGGHAAAPHAAAAAPEHGGGGRGGCAQCHAGSGWQGRGDGDHDRDDRAYHGGHHRGRGGGEVFVGVGPGWWGPPDLSWWYPPPTYAAPPPVVEEQPQEYVEAPATAALSADGYWYYCQSSEAYYPTVATCAEPWVKVRPR